MTCGHPIHPEVLADYWLAVLASLEEESVEEHLLGCDECGERLRELIALAQGIRQLARKGTLQVVVSELFLERAAQQGLRVRQYSPPAGGKVDCTVTAKDDLLIGRLAADLTRVKRLDMCFCDAAGTEQMRFRDIPFGPARSEVIFNYPIEPARSLQASVLLVKLVAVDEQGDRLLDQYTFNHTPS